MGKSNNPAKRATQDAELRAKKSRSSRGSGFMKLVLVLVLSLAICGPFFAGLATIPASGPTPVKTTAVPAPVITPTMVPATAPAAVVPTIAATAPAGQ